MYDTHYFTLHKTCPCQIDNEVVRKTKEIFNSLPKCKINRLLAA